MGVLLMATQAAEQLGYPPEARSMRTRLGGGKAGVAVRVPCGDGESLENSPGSSVPFEQQSRRLRTNEKEAARAASEFRNGRQSEVSN